MHSSKQDEYPVLNGSFKIVASGTTLFVSNARVGLNHQGGEAQGLGAGARQVGRVLREVGLEEGGQVPVVEVLHHHKVGRAHRPDPQHPGDVLVLEPGEELDLLDKVLPLRLLGPCLLYTSPSPRDGLLSRMPSSA